MAAVEVDGLVVRYGDVTAVDSVSFEAAAGQITAVLGPNGAGKTTTIEALEGYRAPDAGRLSVTGLDPTTDHAVLTTRVGVMLQSGGVGPGVRVLEALRHAAALYEHPLDPPELLARVGLTGTERRTWRQISGGEQRRLALALALVGRPQVAFLDEPSSGVDPVGRQQLREVIAGLREDGVTVVLTSHDLDEVERLADHVVILDHGHVLAMGSPASLTAAPVDEVRFGAPPGLDTAALAAHLGSPVEAADEGEYVVRAAGTPALIASLTAWLADNDLPLTDLRAGRQRLEDVFLRLVADEGGAGA
ncbi:MAG: ABC transporter ATP-binding protein [Acidimicrobiales bacterium]